MKLTFGDVARLEAVLEKNGRGGEVTDRDLQSWALWHEQCRSAGIDVGSRETTARLCEVLKTSKVETERALALGALQTAKSAAAETPAKARFVLEFALRRILEGRGTSRLWSAVPLPEDIQHESRRLFELAKQQRPAPDHELEAAINKFVHAHAGDSDIFGRLGTNLQLLLEALRDHSLDSRLKETARAALNYFVLDADAIPDDLGLVGLLDDALIVHEAVCAVRPERAGLVSVLDDVVQSWPFVGDLVLGEGDESHRLSEFMVVNASLLLEKVTASGQKCALVVPEPGPMAFLLGFVRALGEAHIRADSEFKKGDRISNLETGAEFEFDGYGTMVGTSFVECIRDEATYFRVLNRDGRRARAIKDLASFRPATKTQRKRLKAGVARFDRDSVELGPLERVFGSDQPIVLSAERGRVVVVGRLRETRELAERLSILGTPLSEILPVGSARLAEDGIEERMWTLKGPGGEQMITVVTSAADARHVVDDPVKRVIGVVAGVRQGTADATNLAQLAAAETQVIALVQELDAESHAVLEEAGFKFWVWDDSWFGALHWPRASRRSNHALAKFERLVRSSGKAVIEVERCELVGLDNAYRGAKELEKLAANEDDESLRTAAADAMSGVLSICSTVSPLDDQRKANISDKIFRFEKDIESNQMFWSDAKLELCRDTLGSLREALAALERHNPKFEKIQQWAGKTKSAHLMCTTRAWEQLSKQPGCEHLVGADADRSDSSELLVPSWLGRDRMLRVLSLAGFRRTTLVLYPAEIAWYQGTKARNEETKARLQALSSKHVPFRRVKRAASEPPIAHQPVEPYTPDELVFRSLSARAKQTWASSGDETVKARLVHFAGGAWVAFSKWGVTQRIENGTGEEESSLVEVRAEDLRPGDIVVMLKGSDRDALRAEVDKRVPAGTRELASEWKLALRRYLDKGHSLHELHTALSKAGCKRTISTVREWLDDTRIIQPMRGAVEIDMILAATKDDVLAATLEECKSDGTVLRRMHVRVAMEMAADILKKARHFLDSGTAPSALHQLDDRLVLVAVEAVDPNVIDVPVNVVNRLQEA